MFVDIKKTTQQNIKETSTADLRIYFWFEGIVIRNCTCFINRTKA